MSEQQFTDFWQDVLISVHENIRDLRQKQAFADPEEQNYIAGRLFSYEEMLEIFRMSAREAGLKPKEMGL